MNCIDSLNSVSLNSAPPRTHNIVSLVISPAAGGSPPWSAEGALNTKVFFIAWPERTANRITAIWIWLGGSFRNMTSKKLERTGPKTMSAERWYLVFISLFHGHLRHGTRYFIRTMVREWLISNIADMSYNHQSGRTDGIANRKVIRWWCSVPSGTL